MFQPSNKQVENKLRLSRLRAQKNAIKVCTWKPCRAGFRWLRLGISMEKLWKIHWILWYIMEFVFQIQSSQLPFQLENAFVRQPKVPSFEIAPVMKPVFHARALSFTATKCIQLPLSDPSSPHPESTLCKHFWMHQKFRRWAKLDPSSNFLVWKR